MTAAAQAPNQFDNLQVNVPKLYQAWPLEPRRSLPLPPRRFNFLYRLPLPLRWRTVSWHLLHRLRLDQTWFDDFRVYWSIVLGGRPLWGPEDFYFLKNWYRVKFQSLAVADTAHAEEHLAAWQRPEALYQLLHYVYKGSLYHDAHLVATAKRLAKQFDSFLEFGCGTAPITTAYLTFFSDSARTRIVISDIPTLAFHYAALVLGQQSQVTPIALETSNKFAVPAFEPVDVIFCMTVFEHLNQPLDTVKAFYERLNPRGLLVFDYLKGAGDGLDTMAAVNERDAVVAYVRDNFTVVHGSLEELDQQKICIVRKR